MTPLLFPLITATLIVQLLPTPSCGGHALCSWIDGPAGRTTPENSRYSYYCDATAKVLDVGRVVYECWGMHVADWGIVSKNALNFASPCAPATSYDPERGYSPDCDYQYWGVCIGNAQPHKTTLGFQCFYMDGRDSCEWPGVFTADTRPETVQIWHKKPYPGEVMGEPGMVRMRQ